MDAIARLDLSEAERTALSNNIPVAFAVTYLVGVIGRGVGPVAARAEAAAHRPRRGVPQARGADAGRRAAQASARREFEFRAYAVDPGSRFVGRSIAELEASAPGARIFVEQVRSRGEIVAARDVQALREGDVVAVAGRRTTLVEVLEAPGSGLREVDDRELLDLPSDVVDVVVTSQAIDGRTLADLAQDEASRGVFLRRITRAGNDLGHAARHDGAARRRADARRFRREHGARGRASRRGGSRHGRDRHAGRRDRHRRRAR